MAKRGFVCRSSGFSFIAGRHPIKMDAKSQYALYWGCLDLSSISGNLFPFIPILRKLRLYVSHLSRRPF